MTHLNPGEQDHRNPQPLLVREGRRQTWAHMRFPVERREWWEAVAEATLSEEDE